MKLIFTPLMILLGIFALSSCSGDGKGVAPSAPSAPPGAPGGFGARQGSRGAVVTVQTAAVSFGPLMAENNSTGVVAPKTQSNVATQTGGVVQRVYKQAGDWVRQGEVVVQLDTSQLNLSLRTAQTNLQNAKINLEVGTLNSDNANPKLALQVESAKSALSGAEKNAASAEALFKLGGISGSDLDNARAQVQQAQVNLETAKIALEQNKNAGTQNLAQLKLSVDLADLQVQQILLNIQNASVKAPFSGQLAAVNLRPGEYVGLNTPVFILVSPELIINFSVPPSDAMTIKAGDPVIFLFDSTAYPTRISQTPSAPINGLVPLTASLPPGLKAPIGSVGTLRYSLEVAKGAIVPLASLQSNESKTFVFLEKEGKAMTKFVTVLGEAGGQAAVSGLEPGSMVIVNPPPGLLAGSSVQVFTGSGPEGKSGTDAKENPQAKPGENGNRTRTGNRRPGANP